MNNLTKAVLASALVVGAPTAFAIDVLNTNGSGPAGTCQPALPVYDGMVRKRPLAVINEGTSVAYVTCAYTTEEVSLGVRDFSTRVTNLSNVATSTTCTAVIGEEQAGAQYIAKTLELAPGGTGTMTWSAAGDNNNALFSQSVALSCALPPLVGLNRNRVTMLVSVM